MFVSKKEFQQRTGFRDVYKTLRKSPYAEVPFPLTHQEVLEAMESFFAFLELPEERKHHIAFSLSKYHRMGDIGFAHRDPKDGEYNDSKDFFHYHPLIEKKYGQFLQENPVIEAFMTHAKKIWERVYDTMNRILFEFEGHHPGITKQVLGREDDHVMLRFLKYNWHHAGKYLAKPHFDAGSFTLCIAESEPGLRIGSDPNSLSPINHEEGKAVFMLSSNFGKIIDSEEFLPGWHDVIQMDDRQIGKAYARWAIVAFIDAHDVEALPRSETHKWYTG